MTFIHDLDNSNDSQAIQEYAEQARNLIKNPGQLADLEKARDAFNQALLTGTGTVGSLLTHKGLAGLKKRRLDPMFKRGKRVVQQAREGIEERVQGARAQVQNEIDNVPRRLGASIQQDGTDGGAETGDTVAESSLVDRADTFLARAAARRAARRGVVSSMRTEAQSEAERFGDEVADAGAQAASAPAPSVLDDAPTDELAEALSRRAAALEFAQGLAGLHNDGVTGVKNLSNDQLLEVRNEYRTQIGKVRQAQSDIDDIRAGQSADEPQGLGEQTGTTAAEQTGTTAAAAAQTGEEVGEKVAAAGTKAAVTDAELGGPEDIAGDIISVAVGLGTLFAGLGSQKAAPEPTLLPQVQPTVQRGLAGY